MFYIALKQAHQTMDLLWRWMHNLECWAVRAVDITGYKVSI